VVPVFGTAQSLVELAGRIKTVFADMPEKSYELIFVNDSSPHAQTETTLEQLYECDPAVTVVTLSKNFGQQAATLCGIDHARGDFIITMDDDLQHRPEDIPQLMACESHDAVIASFQQKKHSLFKRTASRLKGWFDQIILNKPKHIQLTAFRLINRNVINGLKSCQTPYPLISAMLFRITTDIVNVTIEHHHRYEGHSQYTLWKLIKLFSNLIINNSYLMLRILGFIGIGGFGLSLLFSMYLVIRHYFWGFGVSGWASLILATVFIGGLVLFGIGIIGEYLLRILANLEQKNMYFIKKIQDHS
jgi:dolichol-phosphate mannosyltransferase/undecaprenyl-phosphate 4-deoxy-4-formamido-L-arabinose transferase